MDSSPTIPLGELASLVGGSLVGDASVLCRGAAPLYEVKADQVTMVDSPRRWGAVEKTDAVAVVVREAVPGASINQIVAKDPHAAFATIVGSFLPQAAAAPPSIHPSAVVDPTARIGDCAIDANVTIGRSVKIGDRCRLMPGVVLMDRVVIGDDCVLYPGVTLYERTIVGDRVTIHAGSVIGAYGFGYKTHQGQHARTAQLGYVQIDDDVELGACVTIDRGTYGSTRIGAGTKVDNQVMIGHNCQIGRHNLICSQVGVAGSCRTGDYVVLAGQVGLKDHVTLADGAVVCAQSGVMNDIEAGQVYLGSPATTQREQMQIVAMQRRLPEMRRSLKSLERTVERLAAERSAAERSAAERPAAERSAAEPPSADSEETSSKHRAA